MAYPELFLRCLKVVLRSEGGYSNHPNDPGHATMKGITQAVYDTYREGKGEKLADVEFISDEEVYDIYFRFYWASMNLTGIENEELILHIFDQGVNSGVRVSIRLLQRLIGTDDDGYIGPITLRAIRDYDGDVLEDYIKRRKLFYVTLVQKKPQLRVFLRGWLNRVDNTYFI